MLSMSLPLPQGRCGIRYLLAVLLRLALDLIDGLLWPSAALRRRPFKSASSAFAAASR